MFCRDGQRAMCVLQGTQLSADISLGNAVLCKKSRQRKADAGHERLSATSEVLGFSQSHRQQALCALLAFS